MIRAAGMADVPHLVHCIRELARYERLEHECDPDAALLAEHLFGARPLCGALVAEDDGRAVGFALFFLSYSTFRTRPCMHLEDLFVLPDQRGNGHGLQLLRAVAAEAVRRGCARLDWNVLDWNAPAIGFYQRQGARLLPDWRTCRLDGEALDAVARAAAP
jgi:GNAT superfamily N-acetyltransferase